LAKIAEGSHRVDDLNDWGVEFMDFKFKSSWRWSCYK